MIKVVELVGGRYVIDGVTPSSFPLITLAYWFYHLIRAMRIKG